MSTRQAAKVCSMAAGILLPSLAASPVQQNKCYLLAIMRFRSGALSAPLCAISRVVLWIPAAVRSGLSS